MVGFAAMLAIDTKIANTGDWRAETLARVRALIKEADPDVIEEVKWRKPSNPGGVPVWEKDGIICTGEDLQGQGEVDLREGRVAPGSFRPVHFSLDGNVRRAIDSREGDKVNERR